MVPLICIEEQTLYTAKLGGATGNSEMRTLAPGLITALVHLRDTSEYEFVLIKEPASRRAPSLEGVDMLQILRGEGITFLETPSYKEFVDTHAESGNYNLEDSIIVSDLSNTSWKELAAELTNTQQLPDRIVTIERTTKETKIALTLNLDGSGEGSVQTGIPFFNHMLDQLVRHGNFNVNLSVEGDLEVDNHHTIEDTAIVLGEAFLQALGDKKGVRRYGAWLPMDEARAEVLIDFCSRPYFVYNLPLERSVGGIEPEMFYHFFKSFSDSARCTLHMSASGVNGHHMVEILFKAFAHALKRGVRRSGKDLRVLTTKGSL